MLQAAACRTWAEAQYTSRLQACLIDLHGVTLPAQGRWTTCTVQARLLAAACGVPQQKRLLPAVAALAALRRASSSTAIAGLFNVLSVCLEVGTLLTPGERRPQEVNAGPELLWSCQMPCIVCLVDRDAFAISVACTSMLMTGFWPLYGQGGQDEAGSTVTAALQHPALLQHFLQPAAYAGPKHSQALGQARNVHTTQLLSRLLDDRGSGEAAGTLLSARPYMSRW